MNNDDYLPLTTEERLYALAICQALREDDLDTPRARKRLHQRLDKLLDLHYLELYRIATLKIRLSSKGSLLTKRPAGMGPTGESNEHP